MVIGVVSWRSREDIGQMERNKGRLFIVKLFNIFLVLNHIDISYSKNLKKQLHMVKCLTGSWDWQSCVEIPFTWGLPR